MSKVSNQHCFYPGGVPWAWHRRRRRRSSSRTTLSFSTISMTSNYTCFGANKFLSYKILLKRARRQPSLSRMINFLPWSCFTYNWMCSTFIQTWHYMKFFKQQQNVEVNLNQFSQILKAYCNTLLFCLSTVTNSWKWCVYLC